MPERNRERFGLPPRMFMYTLDQIAMILNMPLDRVKKEFIHYEGRSPGSRPFKKMHARDIANEGTPEWRVQEDEFVRWMRYKGFRVYIRGWATR